MKSYRSVDNSRSIWEGYLQYCDRKQLAPFTDVAQALWEYDLTSHRSKDPNLDSEIAIIHHMIKSHAAAEACKNHRM